MRQSAVRNERETCAHFNRPLATQRRRSEPVWLQNGSKCSSGLWSLRCQFT